MKINKLEIENVKRVKAVRIRPSENGLTIIGGDNEQGKTSVLDAIAYALGGEKYRPTNLNREGSVVPGTIKIVMDNGLIVERKGKNAALKVTDPTGKAAGQRLLDQFIEKLALDLPKFMEASGKEKADTLLQIIGVGPQLDELNRKEKELFDERTITGRTADRKTKYAAEQPYYPDVPAEPASPMELIQRQQAILAKNGENQRKRERLNEITANKHRVFDDAQAIEERIEELQKQLDEKKSVYEQLATDEEIAFWMDVFEDFRKVTNPDGKPKTRNQIVKWLRQPYTDGSEYRLFGNGIALPVVYFIMAGIVWADSL